MGSASGRRGFSLVQVGFAEAVFHIASLIFEIPSGMLADIYGRKKMLIAGQVLGGFVSAMADDALQIRTDVKLQDMFSSEKRATLISISSFSYSVVMIVMSPLAGYFFARW